MHTLNLKEQFVLLAIHDNKGHFVSTDYMVNLGVLSAALMDEVLANRLRIKEGQIELLEQPEDAIDRMLHTALKEKPKAQKLKKAMHQLSGTGGEIKEKILQQLIHKNILSKEEGKILWVFNTKKWPTENPIPELRLKARFHQILIDGKTPDAKELMILQLVEACQLFKEIFPELKERRKATKKMKTLQTDDPIAKELDQTIKEAVGAIIAVSTAVMVSTTMVN